MKLADQGLPGASIFSSPSTAPTTTTGTSSSANTPGLATLSFTYAELSVRGAMLSGGCEAFAAFPSALPVPVPRPPSATSTSTSTSSSGSTSIAALTLRVIYAPHDYSVAYKDTIGLYNDAYFAEESVRCADPAAAASILQYVARGVGAGAGVGGRAVACGTHVWMVRQCGGAAPSASLTSALVAATSSSSSAGNGNASIALCVDCPDPCAPALRCNLQPSVGRVTSGNLFGLASCYRPLDCSSSGSGGSSRAGFYSASAIKLLTVELLGNRTEMALLGLVLRGAGNGTATASGSSSSSRADVFIYTVDVYTTLAPADVKCLAVPAAYAPALTGTSSSGRASSGLEGIRLHDVLRGESLAAAAVYTALPSAAALAAASATAAANTVQMPWDGLSPLSSLPATATATQTLAFRSSVQLFLTAATNYSILCAPVGGAGQAAALGTVLSASLRGVVVPGKRHIRVVSDGVDGRVGGGSRGRPVRIVVSLGTLPPTPAHTLPDAVLLQLTLAGPFQPSLFRLYGDGSSSSSSADFAYAGVDRRYTGAGSGTLSGGARTFLAYPIALGNASSGGGSQGGGGALNASVSATRVTVGGLWAASFDVVYHGTSSSSSTGSTSSNSSSIGVTAVPEPRLFAPSSASPCHAVSLDFSLSLPAPSSTALTTTLTVTAVDSIKNRVDASAVQSFLAASMAAATGLVTLPPGLLASNHSYTFTLTMCAASAGAGGGSGGSGGELFVYRSQLAAFAFSGNASSGAEVGAEAGAGVPGVCPPRRCAALCAAA